MLLVVCGKLVGDVFSTVLLLPERLYFKKAENIH